jgi:hypothetical protein
MTRLRIPSGPVRVVSVGLVFLAAGCATTTPKVVPTASDLESLRGKPLTIVTYSKPTFVEFTADKIAFGALGGAIGGAIAGGVAQSAGDRLVAENGIEDPAKDMVAALRTMALARTGASEAPTLTSSDDKIENLDRLAHGTGVVLDVKTMGWMINYYPTNWTHYHITYGARARLIEAGSHRIIAEASCRSMTNDESKAPSYSQLTENQAALLKSYLSDAGRTCAAQFAKALFNTALDGPALVASGSGPPSHGSPVVAPSQTSVPLPDVSVRASGLLSKPATALTLDSTIVLNKTWIYPHPLDLASYGNVELTFTPTGLSASSKRGRSTGSYDVKDDQLCISLASSGTTCYFLVQDEGQTKLFFSKSGIKSSLVIREMVRQPEMTPVATGRARAITDRVPFLSDERQAVYQQKFLTLQLPRACAISDNGHLSYTSGTRPKDPTLPKEPTARALQLCAAVAGRACVLYAVDNEVVYQPADADSHAVSP